MKFLALLTVSLVTVAAASPGAHAMPGPGGYYGPGFNRGYQGQQLPPGYYYYGPTPGYYGNPGYTPYPSRGPGYMGNGGPRWGGGYAPSAPLPPPRYNRPPATPAPQKESLCEGDFSGTLDNGETIDMSITVSGKSVTAKVTGSGAGESYIAHGTCQESKGVAHINLTIANGASTSAKIYVSDDGTTYLDGSQNGDDKGFLLQKQQD